MKRLERIARKWFHRLFPKADVDFEAIRQQFREFLDFVPQLAGFRFSRGGQMHRRAGGVSQDNLDVMAATPACLLDSALNCRGRRHRCAGWNWRNNRLAIGVGHKTSSDVGRAKIIQRLSGRGSS
jgi:hypothetical protein